jgi:CrcB protein
VSLPIDPDLEGPDASAIVGSSPFRQSHPSRLPRLRWDVLAVVFVGGCFGGWVRYGITSTWPTSTGRFPWATFDVNVAGAFVLAVVVVVAADVVSSRYLRPLLGTGFCGAFTTFSAIVVTTDQLFAHHHQRIAVTYLAASIIAGLAAVSLGFVAARAATAGRRREKSPS